MNELEKEIREKVFEEIMSLDLSEAKEISADYYMAAIRMRMVCASIAKAGAPSA